MRTRRQPTEAQKQQAAANRERFKQLCQRVAAMSEDRRAALTARYGLTTVEGHSLSPYNCCLIISQCPDFTPTIVGGFNQWRKAGRIVTSGKGSGLMLWIPNAKRKAAEDQQPADVDAAERPGFVLGYVWDITQTAEIETAAPQS